VTHYVHAVRNVGNTQEFVHLQDSLVVFFRILLVGNEQLHCIRHGLRRLLRGPAAGFGWLRLLLAERRERYSGD
jgi:hypothetical protein